jgi:putative ABC transport system ATP-binding protein
MTILDAGADTVPLPNATETILELEGVSKIYRSGSLEVRALYDVSLSISRGQYVAIVGPSGSGKSTLMNILGCLDGITEGRYRLDGVDVEDLTETQLAAIRNRRIGFVFQQFNLLPSLNAWRNVELPLCYGGVHRDLRRQRAEAALARVGLADRIHHRPSELSGGQQQRVAIARALVTDPALILADEPTGNLDSRSSQDVMDLLTELNQSGRTIVLITHDADVATAAQRVISVRDGVVQSDAETDGSRRPLTGPDLGLHPPAASAANPRHAYPTQAPR